MAETTRETDRVWAHEQIEQYQKILPRYARLAQKLQQVLTCAATRDAPLAIVQSRPKAVASFAEKAQRKKGKYRDPLIRMTDLCGARVITHTHSEVKAISAFIEKHFDVDAANSVDVTKRLKPTEFGYRSVHYVVQLRRGEFPTADVPVEIQQDLYPDPACPMKAEIQVRTLLEHAWADFGHDRVYKSEFTVPTKQQRELAGLAAMLEKADDEFAGILEGLKTYSASYGAYMTEEKMRDEIEILETVLAHDPHNALVAHRIGKLAMTLGDWQQAIDVFSKYAESRYPPLLRDLGIMLCQVYAKDRESAAYRRGQQYLEQTSAEPYNDVDALAPLAGSWKTVDEERTRTLYRRAFQVDPTDPYAVSNYLVYEIMHKRSLDPVSLMNPSIDAAMQRSRDQAQVGMNLPWAYYNLGMFYLLLQQPNESLMAYAKAIQLSTNAWMIETSQRLLEHLGAVRHVIDGYESVRRSLLVGRRVKFPNERVLEQIKQIASPDLGGLSAPVVIIAGGCGDSVDVQMPEYGLLLVEAFRGFSGTLVSGGTTTGICGWVGDVQTAYASSIATVGYVPQMIPAGATLDPRYKKICLTPGDHFSVLEPIQYWTDLIAAGISPAQVKLLGINGGPISAVEYRLALAFGAQVGVLEESGREAARLIQDEDWNTCKSLLRLPSDVMTLNAFLVPGSTTWEPESREELAQIIHATYRENQAQRSSDPSLAGWSQLDGSLKESNRAQADDLKRKLDQIGYAAQKINGPQAVIVELSVDEIDRLAEMEHGRWVVERLANGWRLGEKDIAHKTTPYLVPWSQLSEQVREWDRQTVRAIPEFLSKAGFELRR